jgi:hypothetical protein
MPLRNFFRDRGFWIGAVFGLVCMLLTFHFNVNPVEGGVVAKSIRGTGLHVFLFVTSMPAYLTGLILGRLLPVPFPAMAFIVQIFFYGVLGWIVHCGIKSIYKR